jgi:hypothetical protein
MIRDGRRGRSSALAVLSVLVLALATQAPVFAEDKGVIVLVPGLTGSKLRNPETGQVIWGNGKNLLFPRDGGYSLAVPIDRDLPARLEAFDVVRTISLGFFRRKFYGPLLTLFEKGGRTVGSLLDPKPSDDFLTFPYDWRLDLVSSAQELGEILELLRLERGQETLQVSLICQSFGASVCRYFAKYGGLALEEAELGVETGQRSISIEHVVLVGTANGGAIRSFLMLDRGRSYIPGIGRHNHPESAFTMASLYQDLPIYRADLFLDLEGRPLEVDLMDPHNWVKYGWSIFGDKSRSRVEASGRKDLFADEAARLIFLERTLGRARRLHQVLKADSRSFLATAYHSIQSKESETLERAVLARTDNGWSTYFHGDEELEGEEPVVRMLSSSGDGHGTQESQDWLSAQETALLATSTVYVSGGHFSLILDPAAEALLSRIFELESPR